MSVHQQPHKIIVSKTVTPSNNNSVQIEVREQAVSTLNGKRHILCMYVIYLLYIKYKYIWIIYTNTNNNNKNTL